MRFTKFEITNFKGILQAVIELPSNDGAITALIGLNESGKTTILEGVSHFLSEDEDVSALYPDGNRNKKVQDLLPKGRKANFSDKISVRAHLKLSETDVRIIAQRLQAERGVEVNVPTFPRIITVSKNHLFEASKFKSNENNWGLNYESKQPGQRKYRAVGFAKNNDEWNACIKIISALFPKICYFPSFLFDFPERIYLSEQPEENKAQSIYRKTLEDVLKYADKSLSWKTHILDRIADFKKSHPGPHWTQVYAASDTKDHVNAAVEKIETAISKAVFHAWAEIFSSKIKNKTISIEVRFDFEKEDAPYFVFSVKDGGRTYSVSERSLGFRWFFSFLLFTKFRRARDGTATLFLFDEPASNLHALAQMKLLESFPQIIGGESAILYSTHSQHMIDPLRLDHSYIVQNLAIDMEADIDDEFAPRDTDIKATKYRTFVGKNPDKGAYFQPVLDKIAFVRSPLEMPNNVVIVEGKGDFYVIEACARRVAPNTISVFPSAGATTMDVQIAQCLGFGKKFLVLCDDDKEGQKARDHYRKQYYLDHGTAMTYADLDVAYAGRRLEDFIPLDMRATIEKHFSGTPFSKNLLVRYFQEASIQPALPITPNTELEFKNLLELLVKKLR